jgi:hypothetical protein
MSNQGLPNVQRAYADLLSANTGESSMRLPSVTQRAAILGASADLAFAEALTTATQTLDARARDLTLAITTANQTSGRLTKALIWLNVILAGATVVAAMMAVATFVSGR